MRSSERRKLLGIIRFLSTVCLVGLLISAQTVLAETGWLEDFNDGLPPGLSTSHGVVEVNSGVLEVLSCEGFYIGSAHICFASIWLDHDEIVGTWTFDYYRINASSELGFYFASTGVSSNDIGNYTGGWPELGYCLIVNGDNTFTNSGLRQLRFGIVRLGGACNGAIKADFKLGQGWSHFKIIHDGEIMELYVNQVFVIDFDTSSYSTVITTAEQVNLGLGAGDRLDNLQYSDQDTRGLNIPPGILFPGIAILVVTLGIGGFSYIHGRRKRQSVQIFQRKKRLVETISRDFELSNNNIFALLGLSDQARDRSYSQNRVSHKILNYRYLLHPVRLMIMKILKEDGVMYSADIRSQLGINWGEYGQHLKSLVEREYVNVRDEFDNDARLAKTVYITDFGLNEYNDLIKQLQAIVKTDSAVELVINGNIRNLSDGGLYPQS